MTDPVVMAALVAGIFAVLGSFVSFALFLAQTRTTRRLEQEFKRFEANLKVGSEVELRLYEKSLEDLAKYKLLLKNLHIALGDYKNGIYHQGSSSDTEKKNTYRFYVAWNKLRFPGVYTPPRIAEEIEKMRLEYQEYKAIIYQAGLSQDNDLRSQNLSKLDQNMDFMEKQINVLVLEWKNELLNSKSILSAILGTEELTPANKANTADAKKRCG
jgi:hypothetical protein